MITDRATSVKWNHGMKKRGGKRKGYFTTSVGIRTSKMCGVSGLRKGWKKVETG